MICPSRLITRKVIVKYNYFMPNSVSKSSLKSVDIFSFLIAEQFEKKKKCKFCIGVKAVEVGCRVETGSVIR